MNYIEEIMIDQSQIEKDSYVNKIAFLKGFSSLSFNHNVTFFVGENGSGKSTLLNAIAIAYGFNPEGGTRNYLFSTYQSDEQLSKSLYITKKNKAKYAYFFRAETFFNVASKEEEYGKLSTKGSNNFHKFSHGESFLQLFKSFPLGNSLYLLDEPEAALSFNKQLSLFSLIGEHAKKGSQFIIISHSPILLALPGSTIYSFDGGLRKINYEESSSYQICKSFIDHRETMIEELLKD